MWPPSVPRATVDRIAAPAISVKVSAHASAALNYLSHRHAATDAVVPQALAKGALRKRRTGIQAAMTVQPSTASTFNASEAVDAMRLLLPTSLIIKGGGLNLHDRLIYPEGDLIGRAVQKRRREFIAGRTYAREALNELGQPSVPIMKKSSRAPLWPNGFVGAISHTQMLCAAVVGRAAEFASIGIDIEDDTPLDPDLVPLICLPTELCGRDTIETAMGIDLPKLIFVAKEAFYKLYNPTTDCFLDFLDVKVVINPMLNSFKAHLASEAAPSFLGRRCVGGRFGRHAGTVFALVWLPVD